MEDNFHMKKYSPLIALTLLAGCIALAPLRANAQDAQNAQSAQNAQDAFEREWYDTCYQKKPKDEEKCYQQSKELLEKFSATTKYRPNAERNIKTYERNKAS